MKYPYNTRHWNDLECMAFRADCFAHTVRLDRAMDDAERAGQLDDERRKYTTELVRTLNVAAVITSDLEMERNISNHNATAEKASHARTMLRLQELEKRVDELQRANETLKRSIQEHFGHG